jgi:HK97 family phage major capsid protein
VGDWNSAYTIVDRIGGQVSFIPALFGTARQFPTGQAGLYFRWRVGAAVVAPNAARYLEVL